MMDVMYDLHVGIPENPKSFSLEAPHASRMVKDYDGFVDLLEPVFRKGVCIYSNPTIHEIREYAIQQTTTFVVAHENSTYSVGLEKGFHKLKQKLVTELSKVKQTGSA